MQRDCLLGNNCCLRMAWSVVSFLGRVFVMVSKKVQDCRSCCRTRRIEGPRHVQLLQALSQYYSQAYTVCRLDFGR